MYSTASISFPMLGNWSICPPNSFTLFGHTFYYYGLIIAIGFLLAVAYCFRRSEKLVGIKSDDLIDILLFAVPIGIICARAYYVIFFGHYTNLWDMMKIWEGGLAIYGGLIGATITIWCVCRYKKISVLAAMDIIVFGFLIGQCIGRWGNFMNREAFGYETDIFCRMGLTLDGTTIYVHPTYLYESLWNLIGFIALHIISKKTVRKFDGQYFLYYIGWYGLGRVWIEGLRTDSLYIGSSNLRVSQLIAGICVIVSVLTLVYIFKNKKYSPDKLWINRMNAAILPAEGPASEADAEGSPDETDTAEENAAAEPADEKPDDTDPAAGPDTDTDTASDTEPEADDTSKED